MRHQHLAGGFRSALFKLSLALAAGALVPNASADPGVHAEHVVIGQAAGLTGANAGAVKEFTAGANAWLRNVNERGGIHGRRVELITKDDGFDPKRTPAVATELLAQDKVFALFGTRGTPHTESILGMLDKEGVPLIAPSTGATSMHKPVRPMVFNVRSKYQDEVAHAVRQLTTTGVKQIAIFYADDGFGKDAYEGFTQALAKTGLKPSMVQSAKRPLGDIKASVEAIAKSDASAVFVIFSGSEAVRVIREIKALNPQQQFLTLSNNASQAFVKELGEAGRGVMVSQAVPGSSADGMTIHGEFQSMCKKYGVEPTSPALEGYMGARVLTEALARAGKDLSRQKLVKALESMRNFDLGGVAISFSPEDHTGSSFVEMSIIGSDGRFVR